MRIVNRLAAALGIALVMMSTLVGLARATDFIPVLGASEPTNPPKDPPNITQNKGTTTGPSRGN